METSVAPNPRSHPHSPPPQRRMGQWAGWSFSYLVPTPQASPGAKEERRRTTVRQDHRLRFVTVRQRSALERVRPESMKYPAGSLTFR